MTYYRFLPAGAAPLAVSLCLSCSPSRYLSMISECCLWRPSYLRVITRIQLWVTCAPEITAKPGVRFVEPPPIRLRPYLVHNSQYPHPPGGVYFNHLHPLGGGTHYHAWPYSYDDRPSRPYNAGTEHVGFSPTRQTLLAPSAKHREVLRESHEG